MSDHARQTALSLPNICRLDARRSNGRPTLALLSGPLDAYLNCEKRRMWLGLDHIARQRNANALYLAGGDFERAPEAILYDLLDAQRVDGIVFFVPFAGSHSTAERIKTFLDRFRPIPTLNVGWVVPGLPTLSLDEEQGMRAVLDHVIREHDCRRIAYVGRYPTHLGYEGRYRAFERIARAHAVFDPALVVGGAQPKVVDPTILRAEDDLPPWPDTVLAKLGTRDLLPGRDYEAIVASDDRDAIQVLAELQARGIRVPENVLVIGFRNGQEAQTVEPPLTTVHMPWVQVGMRAAELVLDAITGHPLPAQSYVPMELIIRQSCGCHDPLVTEAAVGYVARTKPGPPAISATDREAIVDQMIRGEDAGPDSPPHNWARQLLDRFLAELAPPNEHDAHPRSESGFLDELGHVLREIAAAGGDVSTLHNAISGMRRAVRPHLGPEEAARAEDLCQQSRVVIGQTELRMQARGFWQSTHRLRVLDDVGSALLTTAELDPLLDTLARKLPPLGIQRCYLALYENPEDPTGWARLLMAYDEQGRVDLPPEGLRFPSRALVPQVTLPRDARHALLINALHLGDEQIGLVACQADLHTDLRADTICEMLRRQISSALKEVQLRQDTVEAREHAERSDHLKSHFLSAVSHELRTPLNLLVSLTEMAKQQFAHLQHSEEDDSLKKVRQTIDRLHSSALHLDHLILDVLDLARSQINKIELNRAPLDLRQLLIEVAEIGESLAQQKALDWELDIPDRLTLVNGDRVRLRQVLLNLLNNAVKFTAHGSILLRAFADRGQVMVMVQDTGLGIPEADQKAIFDEFRQSQRSTVRGYGGTGLGLAISKRLIEMHEGIIGVSSSGDEGGGSTFYFALPTLEHSALTAQPKSSVEPSILFLAEDPASSTQLCRHLARQGIAIEPWVPNGSTDWLEHILVAPPDAILMDAAFASHEGWEMIKTLKEHPSTQDTPILFCALTEEENSGSLFEVDYVVKDAAVSELARALKRHGFDGNYSSQGPRILIVDDEPGLLEAYTSIVRSHLPHCCVLWAKDGVEAMQIIHQEDPDLILLDLIMPTMDGFEVMEAIRHSETTRNIPVIVLTGQALTEEDLARLNQGVAAILRKGLFSVEETVAQIEAALARTKCLGNEAQWLVRRAMAYVHAHYTEPISSAEIAEYVSVSQEHLIRCFNRELCMTPVTYLNRWRVKQARTLLETSALSITQVALESGFSSQSYFSRVFKEHMGMSPTAYLSACRRGISLPLALPKR